MTKKLQSMVMVVYMLNKEAGYILNIANEQVPPATVTEDGAPSANKHRSLIDQKGYSSANGDPGNIHYCAFLGCYRSSLPVSV